MKTTWISAIIALSLVLTVALFPKSSWVFRNQVDLLAGPTHDIRLTELGMMGPLIPNWVNLPDTYNGDTPAEKLTHAIYLEQEPRLVAITKYTQEYPNDPLGWATLVRETCGQRGMIPGLDKNAQERFIKFDSVPFQNGVEACLQGERLEPNNAFFPLVRATFLEELGRGKDASNALRVAAAKTEYNSHLRDLDRSMDSAFKSAKGYRGEFVRTVMQASIDLPEFGHLSQLSYFINQEGSLEEKRNYIQIMNLMLAHEEVGIAFAVANSGLRRVISPPLPSRSQLPQRDAEQWTAVATEFEKKLKLANIPSPVPDTVKATADSGKLLKAFQKYVNSEDSFFNRDATGLSPMNRAFLVTVIPYVCLIGLALSLVASVFVFLGLRIQSTTFMAMIPNLTTIPVLWIIWLWIANTVDVNRMSYGMDINRITAGMMVGICQLAFAFLRLERKPAIILTAILATVVIAGTTISTLVTDPLWLGCVVVIIGLAFLPWLVSKENRTKIVNVAGPIVALVAILSLEIPVIISSVVFGVAAVANWIRHSKPEFKVPTWVTVLTYLGLCLASGGAFAIRGIFSNPTSTSIVGFGLTGLLIVMLFSGKTLKVGQAAVNSTLLVLSVLYLLSCGNQVRENQRLNSSRLNLMNEANNIREMAAADKKS